MSQREARGALAMPGVGKSPAKATPRSLAGTDRKRSRLSRTGQDLWEETSWSNPRWSRAAPSPRGAGARRLARGRVRKPGPEEVAGRGRHGRGCNVTWQSLAHGYCPAQERGHWPTSASRLHAWAVGEVRAGLNQSVAQRAGPTHLSQGN